MMSETRSNKKRIFISTSSFGEKDPAPLKALESAGFEVVLNPYKRKLTKEEILKLVIGFDGLIAGLEVLDAQVLSQSQLKVIARCGGGVSNVDLQAADRLGIKVFSTPEAPATAVAELTMAAILSMFRMLPQTNQEMHEGRWNKRTGRQLTGKTVGIVGFGRIGKRVAEFLKPFQVKIIAVDPLVGPFNDVTFLPLREALPQADILTFHVNGQMPLIGEAEFDLMKNGVFILNAARGTVINEQALLKALKTGKVAGAWCDVFDIEPYQGALKDFPQVILTPHIGSYTEECRRSMEMQAAEHIITVFQNAGCHA